MTDTTPPAQTRSTAARFPLPLGMVLVAFVVLALWYDASTPILEASDERLHEAVVQSVAQGHGLPVLTADSVPLGLGPRQEAGQAPLYYLLAGVFTAPIHTEPLATSVAINPHSFIGQPSWLTYNKNLLLHDASERFPYHGLALAVHLGRWLSIVFGGVTVIMTYLLARALFPKARAIWLLAASLLAFNPMVLFIAASVDNDALAMAVCSTATWWLVVGWRRGCPLWWVIVLGVILGLAAMTKLSGLGLVFVAGLVLVREAVRRTHLLWLVARGFLVTAIIALLGGWWYVRNALLYGELTGLNAFLDVAGRRPPTPLSAYVQELPGLWTAFWGVFGGFDILAPGWMYQFFAALTVAAALGMVLEYAVRRDWLRSAGWALLVPIAWIALECVALVRWTTLTMASSGRLLYPAIGSIVALAALGLLAWLPRRWSHVAAWTLTALLACVAAAIPALAIRPAYAAPVPLPASAVPTDLEAANTMFGDDLTLLGASWPPGPYLPGSTIPVTLFWQARQPSPVNYSESIQIVGEQDQKVAQFDMLLGSGMWGTTQWRPGAIYRDVMLVHLPPSADAPSTLRVRLSVYQWGAQGTLRVHGAEGEANELIAGTVDVRSADGATSTYPNPLKADFGGVAALRGYELSTSTPHPGDTLTLTLYWQGEAHTAINYTVFVHIADEQDTKAGQHDSQPLEGKVPTSAWQQGQVIRDHVQIAIRQDAPPERYRVLLGMYDLATLRRLQLAGGGDVLTLAVITVA
jgi:hypothetical protein